MFCGECGTQNPDTNQFCKNCGKPLKRPPQAPASRPAAVPYQPPAAQPATAQPAYYPSQQPVYGQQPAFGQPPVPTGAAPATARPPLNKVMLVVGILGILAGLASFLRYPYLLGILAIVLGGVAIAKPENRRGAVMVIGILAILIGLGAMLFDVFYIDILSPAPPDL
ncbi:MULTISPECIES: zinc-ribbon domain-containing protein [unclassified Methanoregula]|uniref:zinc-ribbon domain-containing protein n=1 Tax=unclassified Methanoregula TaxID=2649730 RepID=UPI0009C56F27|nr:MULTISPECIES: zinc-ribbon domain-containing protein [unclassified Methanoregula]OPX62975.1 MAG: hypothetical protein A4E33_02107 [Methanoregula sp. PtaB.Bin085]OPY35188.1 MAG: hypothetical protein A4E34_00996 [Methanoregula sp. PtaU1.Bin006]